MVLSRCPPCAARMYLLSADSKEEDNDMSWLKKLTSGLRKSSEKVTQNLSSLSRLFGKEKIDAASLEELEDALIMADIGVPAATDIVAALKAHKWKGEVTPDAFRRVLAEHLTEILNLVEKPLAILEDMFLTKESFRLERTPVTK